MKKRLLFMLAILFVGIQSVRAQSGTIKGKITDEKGEPVIGATIRVKGTNKGAVSDMNGNFKVSADNKAMLIFSAVGMKTIEKSAQDGQTVVLDNDSKMLNETVVTALGIKRNKAELGYAAQKVAGSEVTATRSSNALNSLSGKVSGLEIKQNNQMGGSTNIVIRGFKSLTGNNQALIVIDGVPYDNSNTNTGDQTTARGGYDFGNAAADINPDDIASINVLKGAAATALYGSRAANGVILIETKKGKKGLNIEVNTGMSTGIMDKSTFPKYQKQYGAGYGPYYGDTLGGFIDNSMDWNNDGLPDLTTNMTEDASYGLAFNPNILVYDWRSVDPSSPYYMKPTPWVAGKNDPSYFIKNTYSASNGFNISTANDKSNLKISYTRTDDKGMLANSKLWKNLFSVGVNHNVNEKITVGMAANATVMGAVGRYGTGYDSKNPMGSFRQWWQTNVDVKDLEDAYLANVDRNTTWNWGDYTDVSSGPIFWDNPYWIRYKSYENDSRNRVFGNVYTNYKLNSWINIMGRLSLDSYHEQQEERNGFGAVDLSEYSIYKRTYNEINYDLISNFSRSLSKNIKLSGLAGINIRRQKQNSIFASTNGGLVVPNYYNLNNTKFQLNAPTNAASDIQQNGYFANTNFGYKEIIFLDLTGRTDVSSTLAKGNRTYFYPSASLTYVFSKYFQNEKKMDWLNYGKLRLNYASVGNSAPFGVTRDYLSVQPSFNGVPVYSSLATKNNPNLRPERTSNKEIGLELAFLKNRITLDATYYYAKSIDQIIPLAISLGSGFTNKYLNAGTILNKGIELQLGIKPIMNKNFSWDINVNYTRNRNEVIELPDGVDNLQIASLQGGVTINATKGQPYGVIKGQTYEMLNGQRLVEDGYWVRTATSDHVIGNINPKFLAGIRNSFKYKNLALSFLIDMKKGGSVFSLDQFYAAQTGIYETSVGLNDKGNPIRDFVADGGGVLLPGLNADGTPNTTYVEANDYTLGDSKAPSDFVYDASYIKLREMTLSYSLPSKLFKKGFKGAEIGVYGRNLWIIHKNLPYADPEDGMSSGNIQGYQSGVYPTMRIMGVNLKLNF
jgi:TonB-linked SusC/RagA family outer membrane protein